VATARVGLGFPPLPAVLRVRERGPGGEGCIFATEQVALSDLLSPLHAMERRLGVRIVKTLPLKKME
jgi:hypothetical protein